ncbi:MAG: hypothetical protein ACHQ9S_07890 [Candidatus Binatia bacterium]
MDATDRETWKQADETGSILTRLTDAIIEVRQRVVRLSEDHYLVQWQPKSAVWCVINMAALDEHTEACSRFRFRHCCEHIDLIYELCEQEKETGSEVSK